MVRRRTRIGKRPLSLKRGDGKRRPRWVGGHLARCARRRSWSWMEGRGAWWTVVAQTPALSTRPRCGARDGRLGLNRLDLTGGFHCDQKARGKIVTWARVSHTERRGDRNGKTSRSHTCEILALFGGCFLGARVVARLSRRVFRSTAYNKRGTLVASLGWRLNRARTRPEGAGCTPDAVPMHAHPPQRSLPLPPKRTTPSQTKKQQAPGQPPRQPRCV